MHMYMHNFVFCNINAPSLSPRLHGIVWHVIHNLMLLPSLAIVRHPHKDYDVYNMFTGAVINGLVAGIAEEIIDSEFVFIASYNCIYLRRGYHNLSVFSHIIIALIAAIRKHQYDSMYNKIHNPYKFN